MKPYDKDIRNAQAASSKLSVELPYFIVSIDRPGNKIDITINSNKGNVVHHIPIKIPEKKNIPTYI